MNSQLLLFIILISAQADAKRWSSSDNAQGLFDSQIQTSFKELNKYQKGESLIKPWIGAYWRNNYGGLGRRYRDDLFKSIIHNPTNRNEEENDLQLEVYSELRSEFRFKEIEIENKVRGQDQESFNHLLNQQELTFKEKEKAPLSLSEILSGHSSKWSLIDDINGSALASLSPVEKYDLLIGDDQFTLRGRAWKHNEVRSTGGSVPEWMGYCNGLAVASSKAPEPQKAVYALSPKGIIIPFYPEDLKALSMLQWSNKTALSKKDKSVKRKKLQTDIIGHRCEKDQSDNSRLDLYKCIDDTNPATFHLALVNKIGLEKKSFIADVDQWSQVWNFPISSYSYSHSLVSGENLLKLKQDYFNLIEKSAKSFLKVRMSFDIPKFGDPGASREVQITRTSFYYLELDSKGDIIGGFWDKEAENNTRPDFLWRVRDTKAKSFAEQNVENLPKWKVEDGVIPEQLINIAQRSSQNFDVLGSIIDSLIEASVK